jgi:hypothetical protein
MTNHDLPLTIWRPTGRVLAFPLKRKVGSAASYYNQVILLCSGAWSMPSDGEEDVRLAAWAVASDDATDYAGKGTGDVACSSLRS